MACRAYENSSFTAAGKGAYATKAQHAQQMVMTISNRINDCHISNGIMTKAHNWSILNHSTKTKSTKPDNIWHGLWIVLSQS